MNDSQAHAQTAATTQSSRHQQLSVFQNAHAFAAVTGGDARLTAALDISSDGEAT